MADIVICEHMGAAAVDGLASEFDVLYDPALHERGDALAAALGDCRALVVRNRARVTASLLDDGPDLVAIGRLGIGVDNIDLDACKKRGIRVFPASGANVTAVAEYVVAAVHILLRGIFHASAEVLAGEWPCNGRLGRETEGKSIGIVGFGTIGRSVARRVHALGMTPLAFDPHVAEDDEAWSACGTERCERLEDLLGRADVVSVHVPLVPTTRNLLDADALAAMKPGACLVNAARGGVLDEAALVEALREERLGGAMLDVFRHEPLAAGSIFDGVPNLILTPHVAGITEESNERMSAMIAARIREALA